jgi:DNA polymerase-3 subunit epsilon
VYWPDNAFIVIDVETTGLDIKSDRVIQVGIAVFHGTKYVHHFKWLSNVEYPSCTEALATHNIDDEYRYINGIAPEILFKRVKKLINLTRTARKPIMFFNAPFDLRFLNKECGMLDREHLYIIDPLVIERHYQKSIPVFTKPWMRLLQMSLRYGVEAPTHDALDDAIATGYVAIKQSLYYPSIRRCSLPELHARQIRWHAEWSNAFANLASKRGFQFKPLEWPHGDEISSAH